MTAESNSKPSHPALDMTNSDPVPTLSSLHLNDSNIGDSLNTADVPLSLSTPTTPAASAAAGSGSGGGMGTGGGAVPPGGARSHSATPGRMGAAGNMGARAGGVKVPPSLQEKMKAMAARSGNPGANSFANMRQDQHLNPSLFGVAGGQNSRPHPQPSFMGRRKINNNLSLKDLQGDAPSGSQRGGTAGNEFPTLPSTREVPMTSAANGLSMLPNGGGSPTQGNGGTGGTGGTGGSAPPPTGMSKKRGPPGGMKLSGLGGPTEGGSGQDQGNQFERMGRIVDPSGRLNFERKAVLHAKGVDFSSGASFEINMEDLTVLEELGKGNYGTVQKVLHRPSNVTMAMKEIRLELDESKLKGIITELDILHRATSPFIVEFYGAFFVEGCVYLCMEYMDAGSLDHLAGADIPVEVLARITNGMVEGLRFLKDELQTMHRDVKPTNMLINRKGEVKLCDFGVSGQLERSLAKTNIGCQSYMAPERIQGESLGSVSTYTVASDIWSLGLSLIEFAIGHYPYPPETYSNVFAQLQAIVHGDPPNLPDSFGSEAQDFVAQCLQKVPKNRPTYGELLQHPFLVADRDREVDMAGWVKQAQAQAGYTSLESPETPSS